MEPALKVINQMVKNDNPSIHTIFESKQKRREQLGRLPIEDKVKILVELQKMAAPILNARGVKVAPWKI